MSDGRELEQQVADLRREIEMLREQTDWLVCELFLVAGAERARPELVEAVGPVLARHADGEPFRFPDGLAQTATHPDFGLLSEEDQLGAIEDTVNGYPLDAPPEPGASEEELRAFARWEEGNRRRRLRRRSGEPR